MKYFCQSYSIIIYFLLFLYVDRTSSETTFDSLDLARYSDDGANQADERHAVLEFELRKAKETIKSLRANLTEAAGKMVVPCRI